jgi:hypothetical protein
MQRRDPKTFLEEVLAQVSDLSEDVKEGLRDLVDDKPGAKRASKIAAILAGRPVPKGKKKADDEDDDDEA